MRDKYLTNIYISTYSLRYESLPLSSSSLLTQGVNYYCSSKLEILIAYKLYTKCVTQSHIFSIPTVVVQKPVSSLFNSGPSYVTLGSFLEYYGKQGELRNHLQL